MNAYKKIKYLQFSLKMLFFDWYYLIGINLIIIFIICNTYTLQRISRKLVYTSLLITIYYYWVFRSRIAATFCDDFFISVVVVNVVQQISTHDERWQRWQLRDMQRYKAIFYVNTL